MAKFKPTNAAEGGTVLVEFEGTPVQAPAGMTVAAALLGHANAGHCCTNSLDQSKRAPYCLMGVCFECLVEIDGIPNRQACLTPLVEGMKVRRQQNITEWNT